MITCLNAEKKKKRTNGAFSRTRRGQWLVEICQGNSAEEVSGRKLTRCISSAPQVTFNMNRPDTVFSSENIAAQWIAIPASFWFLAPNGPLLRAPSLDHKPQGGMWPRCARWGLPCGRRTEGGRCEAEVSQQASDLASRQPCFYLESDYTKCELEVPSFLKVLDLACTRFLIYTRLHGIAGNPV